jgi:hypothetical protein
LISSSVATSEDRIIAGRHCTLLPEVGNAYHRSPQFCGPAPTPYSKPGNLHYHIRLMRERSGRADAVRLFAGKIARQLSRRFEMPPWPSGVKVAAVSRRHQSLSITTRLTCGLDQCKHALRHRSQPDRTRSASSSHRRIFTPYAPGSAASRRCVSRRPCARSSFPCRNLLGGCACVAGRQRALRREPRSTRPHGLAPLRRALWGLASSCLPERRRMWSCPRTRIGKRQVAERSSLVGIGQQGTRREDSLGDGSIPQYRPRHCPPVGWRGGRHRGRHVARPRCGQGRGRRDRGVRAQEPRASRRHRRSAGREGHGE